jgi:hypothetical protein
MRKSQKLLLKLKKSMHKWRLYQWKVMWLNEHSSHTSDFP